MNKITTIHIGTTKTGSTSIQSFLARNRDVLAQNSVLYSTVLGPVNHNAIPVYLQGKQANTGLQAKYDIKTEADYAAFADRLVPDLAAEIQSADPRHIIISSEHLHSRCYKPAHFKRLRTLLAPATRGRDLRVIVYLRPQADHVVSLYSTMLRHGATDTVDDFISARMSGREHAYFNFRKLLDSWSAAFPEAQIIVRKFNDTKKLDHGVLTDFLTLEGLDPLIPDMQFETRQNQSMTGWSAEVLRLLNGANPPLPPRLNRAARQWLRHGMPAGKVRPDPQVIRKFQDSFASANAWVADRYLDGDRTALDPNWEAYDAPRPPAEGVSPQQLVALLTKIAKSPQ